MSYEDMCQAYVSCQGRVSYQIMCHTRHVCCIIVCVCYIRGVCVAECVLHACKRLCLQRTHLDKYHVYNVYTSTQPAELPQ